jgi:hypothetical protein
LKWCHFSWVRQLATETSKADFDIVEKTVMNAFMEIGSIHFETGFLFIKTRTRTSMT